MPTEKWSEVRTRVIAFCKGLDSVKPGADTLTLTNRELRERAESACAIAITAETTLSDLESTIEKLHILLLACEARLPLLGIQKNGVDTEVQENERVIFNLQMREATESVRWLVRDLIAKIPFASAVLPRSPRSLLADAHHAQFLKKSDALTVAAEERDIFENMRKLQHKRLRALEHYWTLVRMQNSADTTKSTRLWTTDSQYEKYDHILIEQKVEPLLVIAEGKGEISRDSKTNYLRAALQYLTWRRTQKVWPHRQKDEVAVFDQAFEDAMTGWPYELRAKVTASFGIAPSGSLSGREISQVIGYQQGIELVANEGRLKREEELWEEVKASIQVALGSRETVESVLRTSGYISNDARRLKDTSSEQVKLQFENQAIRQYWMAIREGIPAALADFEAIEKAVAEKAVHMLGIASESEYEVSWADIVCFVADVSSTLRKELIPYVLLQAWAPSRGGHVWVQAQAEGTETKLYQFVAKLSGADREGLSPEVAQVINQVLAHPATYHRPTTVTEIWCKLHSAYLADYGSIPGNDRVSLDRLHVLADRLGIATAVVDNANLHWQDNAVYHEVRTGVAALCVQWLTQGEKHQKALALRALTTLPEVHHDIAIQGAVATEIVNNSQPEVQKQAIDLALKSQDVSLVRLLLQHHEQLPVASVATLKVQAPLLLERMILAPDVVLSPEESAVLAEMFEITAAEVSQIISFVRQMLALGILPRYDSETWASCLTLAQAGEAMRTFLTRLSQHSFSLDPAYAEVLVAAMPNVELVCQGVIASREIDERFLRGPVWDTSNAWGAYLDMVNHAGSAAIDVIKVLVKSGYCFDAKHKEALLAQVGHADEIATSLDEVHVFMPDISYEPRAYPDWPIEYEVDPIALAFCHVSRNQAVQTLRAVSKGDVSHYEKYKCAFFKTIGLLNSDQNYIAFRHNTEQYQAALIAFTKGLDQLLTFVQLEGIATSAWPAFLFSNATLAYLARVPAALGALLALPTVCPRFASLVADGGPLVTNVVMVQNEIFADPEQLLTKAKEIESIFVRPVPLWEQLFLFIQLRLKKDFTNAESAYPITTVGSEPIAAVAARLAIPLTIDNKPDATTVKFCDLSLPMKEVVFKYALEVSIKTSRDEEAKKIADVRNRHITKESLLTVGNYVHGSAVEYVDAVLLKGNLPGEALGEVAIADGYPFHVDFARLQPDQVTLAGGDCARLIGSTMANGYGHTGQKRLDGQIFYIYQRGRQSFAEDIEYGPAAHHALLLGGMPATEIAGIVLRNAAQTLEKIKQKVIDNGFYIPLYDFTGDLLFTAAEYDAARSDGNFAIPVEVWDSKLKVGEQLGSNPGASYLQPSEHGPVRYYVKFIAPDHLWTEHLANSIYRLMDIPVPETKAVQIGATYGHASRWLETPSLASIDVIKHPDWTAGFIVDALLANWDIPFAPYRNALLATDQHLYRTDNGGALVFHARGERKDTASFGPVVHEIGVGDDIHSLREGMRQCYPGLTTIHLREQVMHLQQKLTDTAIHTLVNNVRLAQQDRDYLEKTLKARRDFIVAAISSEVLVEKA